MEELWIAKPVATFKTGSQIKGANKRRISETRRRHTVNNHIVDSTSSDVAKGKEMAFSDQIKRQVG